MLLRHPDITYLQRLQSVGKHFGCIYIKDNLYAYYFHSNKDTLLHGFVIQY